jgi:outer membrane biogenesis lipoprotein LolB
MNRLTLSIFAVALLAGCAQNTPKPDADQAAFGLEQAYTVTAKAEAIVLPSLSASQQAAVRHLDTQAYNEVVSLRLAAQSGGSTLTETKAASDALLALTAALTTTPGGN